MLTLANQSCVRESIEIKRSQFIASLARTDTEAQARAFIDQIKQEFPDARHNCSAYLVPGQGQNLVARSSDDGEPSGTAGMPLLETLKAADLQRVTCVVTRYFGGILLGTGGLVRAYTDAVKLALESAPIVTLKPLELYQLKIGHHNAGKVESQLRGAGYTITDTQYGDAAIFTIGALPEAVPQLHTLVAELTHGQVQAVRSGVTLFEVPASLDSSVS